MKTLTITLTRLSDNKIVVKSFKTKKAMNRFLSNNYTAYTW
jgi:hypothetical protein